MWNTLYFYNGGSGGLGKYLGPALEDASETGISLEARLENSDGLRSEVRAAAKANPSAERFVFLQLASLVSVPLCEKEPERAKKTNVDDVLASVTAFVEEAIELGRKPEVLYVSSGHLYAPKASGKITEKDPVNPRSVYARTKLEAEQVLTMYCETNGIRLTIARVFGLVAPGQPDNYVLPGLIRRAKEKNLTGVPGLDNERDYLDSRDVCRALLRLANRGGSPLEVVNVCSGEGITIRRVLELALFEVYGEASEALLPTLSAGPSRPDDIVSIVGDPSRYVALTGENPKRIALSRTIREAVAFTIRN